MVPQEPRVGTREFSVVTTKGSAKIPAEAELEMAGAVEDPTRFCWYFRVKLSEPESGYIDLTA